MVNFPFKELVCDVASPLLRKVWDKNVLEVGATTKEFTPTLVIGDTVTNHIWSIYFCIGAIIKCSQHINLEVNDSLSSSSSSKSLY